MTVTHPARAWDADRLTIRFPDPAIEVVNERLNRLVVTASNLVYRGYVAVIGEQQQ